MKSARQRPPTRGFALIIVVALLALLVLVLVSLATLTRVETQVGANSLKQAQAQQNARFALGQALGELQRYAGPDTRVTATAEVAGITSANKHWTGVWTSASGALQTWLVSGNENGTANFDATDAPSNLTTSSTAFSNEVQIANTGGSSVESRLLVGRNTVGALTEDNYVVAPLVALEGPVPSEGGTATVGRYAWWVGDEGVKALATDWDHAVDLTYFPYDATPGRDRIRHMALPRVRLEAAAEWGDVWSAIAPSELQKVLTLPQIVFVNAGAGPTESERLTSIRRHYHDLTTISRGLLVDTVRGGLKRDMTGMTPEPGNSSELNRLLRFLTISADDSGGAALYHETGSVSADEIALRPVLVGARLDLTVSIPSAGTSGESGDVTGTITARIWNPYSASLQAIPHRLRLSSVPRLSLERSTGGWTSDIRWSNGSAVEVDLPEQTLVPGGIVELVAALTPSFERAFPAIAPDTRFRLVRYADTLTAEMSNLEGDVVTSGSVMVEGETQTGIPPNVSGVLSVGLRLSDSNVSWLRLHDPRSSTSDPGAWTAISSMGAVPPSMAGSVLGSGGLVPVVAFDLPALTNAPDEARAVSLGVLTHLQMPNAGAFAIGSSHGGTDNDVFDQYFLSTLPVSVGAWNPADGAPLPNTRLEVWGPNGGRDIDPSALIALPPERRAGSFLVRGGFNVNSTSASAWAGVLGGERIGGSPEEQHVIFRLPRSVPATLNGSEPTWTRSFRSLSSVQLSRIAEALGTNVRTMGPFHSVEAFLNSGAVQQAINESGINTVGLPPPTPIPPELTQAELLAGITPLLMARSDTFTIRAYGESVNPLIDPNSSDYVQARAWCEATVQRIPTMVDTSVPIQNEATGFGRRFVITSFRWLSPDDI